MTITSTFIASDNDFAVVTPTLPVSGQVSGGALSVTLIDSVSAWQADNSEWSQLTHGHPLHSQAWLRTWWQELGSQHGQLAIARISDSNQVVGYAPFFVERTWKGTTLRFLGSGATCTDYLDIFCRPGHAPRVAQALGHWLDSACFRKTFGAIDLIELEGHHANAAGVTAWQDVLAHRGWTEEIAPLEGCWVVEFPPTWDEYVSRLSHRGRRRARNAIKNLQAGAMTFHAWDQHDDVVAHWQAFVNLHQKRRHQKGELGCFAAGPFEQFLRRAAFRLVEIGQASLVEVRFEEKAIAAALQMHGQNTRFLYQTGMDSDYIKLEPGHIINAMLLNHAQSHGAACFDFLRGNEPYKARWGAQPVPLVRTRLWNPRLTAQVRAHMLAVGRCVKQWFQNDSLSNYKEQD